MIETLLNNRYRIINTIASGGFGKVFLAEDNYLSTGDRCVIKQLKPIAQAPKIQNLITERFQKEAEILAALGENNSQIPKLYDYFTEKGQFYLVQEWIEGETLSNLVKFEGVFSENKVKDILISILSVLDYIHSNKIIHRDIKPNNIILRFSDGLPVLIDFGAVKETMRTNIDPEGNLSSSIIVGTPGYMPSEQAIGRPVYSSDLYALGLVGIYLLTGKIPQDLGTDSETGEILWHQYSSELSPSLVTTIDRSIRYHPRDRFSTASEMLAALQYQESSLFLTTLPPLEAEVERKFLEQKISNTKSEIFFRQKPSKIIGRSNLIRKSLLGSSLVFSTFLTPAPRSIVVPTAQISPKAEIVASPTPQATPTSASLPTVAPSTKPAIEPTVQTSSTVPILSSKSASSVQPTTPPVTKVQTNSTNKTTSTPRQSAKTSNSTSKTTSTLQQGSKPASKPTSSTTPVSSNSTSKPTTNTTKTTTETPSTIPAIFKSSKSTTTSKTPSSATPVSSNSTSKPTTNTTKSTTKKPSTIPAIFKSSKSTTTSKTPSSATPVSSNSKSKTTTSSKPTTKAPSTKTPVSRSSQTASKPTARVTPQSQTTARSTARVVRSTVRKEISERRESKVEVRKERRDDRAKEMRKQTREERKKRD